MLRHEEAIQKLKEQVQTVAEAKWNKEKSIKEMVLIDVDMEADENEKKEEEAPKPKENGEEEHVDDDSDSSSEDEEELYDRPPAVREKQKLKQEQKLKSD